MANDPAVPGSPAPTFAADLLFRLKATGLRADRGLRNLLGPSRHRKTQELPPIIVAEARSPLWTSESHVERSLQLGKIENLRIAVRRLNGTRIEAGREFS